jgi:glycine oxidase
LVLSLVHDVLLIGGGVIGLSLAWDLARHGQSVRVIDRGQPGREASWAGAGILPAARFHPADHPYEQLYGLSCELHPKWAEELRGLTGIDTGYRRSGGLHLARTPGESASLAAWAADLAGQGMEVRKVSAEELAAIEPGLRTQYSVLSTQYSAVRQPLSQRPLIAYLVPGDAQLRNPRHLQALFAACTKAGVEITANLPAGEFVTSGGQIDHIQSPVGPIRARRYCFTAGAWTGQLLARLGMPIGVLPIRGQMVLFRCLQPVVSHILHEGSRYLVSRDDGRVLAGSTEEEVGFDKRTTEEAISDLQSFARSLVPALAEAHVEQTWAGLRPGSLDGLPYLGPLPGLANGFIAAGHFRSGLCLSPATAVVMSQLVRDEAPQIELAPFRAGR